MFRVHSQRHQLADAVCAAGHARPSDRPALQRRSVTAAASGGRGGGGVSSAGAGSREPLLTVDGVTKTHDGEAVLFSDVTFTVHRGDRLAVVGPNGSGARWSTCP